MQFDIRKAFDNQLKKIVKHFVGSPDITFIGIWRLFLCAQGIFAAQNKFRYDEIYKIKKGSP